MAATSMVYVGALRGEGTLVGTGDGCELGRAEYDIGGFVDDAKKAVSAQVVLPGGYYMEWTGEYENQASARARLELVLPIVLAVIFVMLYFTYH